MVNSIELCILAYNNEDIIGKILKNIADNVILPINCRVLVLDNGSTDNTFHVIKKFPFVDLLRLEQNRFFSGGANFLFDNCKAEHVFFMSSDIILRCNTLPEIIEFVETNPDAGIVGCKSVRNDETLENACYRFHLPWMIHFESGLFGLINHPFRKMFNNYHKYYKEGFPFSMPMEVEVIQDSFFYIRGGLLKKRLRFNEYQRLYFTEDDLCAHVKKYGYKVIFLPAVEVGHYSMATVGKDIKETRNIYLQDALAYCKKWFGNFHFYLLKADMHLANLIRRILKRV